MVAAAGSCSGAQPDLCTDTVIADPYAEQYGESPQRRFRCPSPPHSFEKTDISKSESATAREHRPRTEYRAAAPCHRADLSRHLSAESHAPPSADRSHVR